MTASVRDPQPDRSLSSSEGCWPVDSPEPAEDYFASLRADEARRWQAIRTLSEGIAFLITEDMWLQGDGYGGQVINVVSGVLFDINGGPPDAPPSTKRRGIRAKLRTEVFERDEYRCRRCGTHLELTADHIHPVARGGTDELDNLQTLCRPCNSSKGAR